MDRAKIRHNIFLAIAGMIALLQSCAPVYRPNTIFSPMFERQGQLKAAGSFGSNGLNVHAGYSITDNLAVTGGMLYASDIDSPGRTFFGEAGAGWYFPASVFRLEVLSGVGLGVATATGTYPFLTERTIEAQGVYGRFYLQPALGVSISVVDLSIASRAVWIHFFRFEETGIRGEVARNVGGLFMEPALTLAVGPENFKAFGQFGFSIPSRGLGFDHLPFLFSAGVRLSLDRD